MTEAEKKATDIWETLETMSQVISAMARTNNTSFGVLERRVAALEARCAAEDEAAAESVGG